jgi:hypothetical protein
VSEKPDQDEPIGGGDRISIPLDPVEALRVLLKVDPESEPVKPENDPEADERPPDES